VHRTQGVKAYLEMRDGPSNPSPWGALAKAKKSKPG